MIEYFMTDESHRALVKFDEEREGCWIALFEPTLEELRDVSGRFGIDIDDMRAALDLEEVSRVERNPDYTMFIVDTPVHDRSLGDHGYKTIPIGIFETESNVISVCSAYRIPIIAHLKSRKRLLHATNDIKGFTCDLLLASAEAYFVLLRALNRRRRELSAVTERPSRKDLELLYAIDASFVYVKTSLTTNDTVFERYRRYVLMSCEPEIQELFDDVLIEHRQALETTKIYSEILDSTIEHFGLMMDYDLNRTMQLVATFTLVLCVPTVIGGLFGMNLEGIPLADSPYGFAIVTGATALVFVLLLVLLKRLRWF